MTPNDARPGGGTGAARVTSKGPEVRGKLTVRSAATPEPQFHIIVSPPGRAQLDWADQPRVRDWRTFVGWLRRPVAGGKTTRPYVPVTLRPDQTRRTHENIVARYAATLDADHAGPDFLDRLRELLGGRRWLAHTTASSTQDAPRWRVIVPYARPVTVDEARQIAGMLVAALGEDRFDVQASVVPAQVAYAPAWPEVVYAENDGPPLEPDDWLLIGDGNFRAPAPDDPGLTEEEWRAAYADRPSPSCHYGRAALDGALADFSAIPEGHGVHAGVYRLAARYVELVNAGCAGLDDEPRLADAALAARATPRPREWEEALQSALRRGVTGRVACTVHGDPVAELWRATPTLARVYAAARARMVAPTALLAHVLARVLLETPIGTVLPPIVGSRASLNLGFVVMGPSGAGKSSLAGVAVDLLGLAALGQENLIRPVGSGEGLAAAYLHPVGRGAARHLVVVDDPRRLFLVDEVADLTAKADRSGATLLPTVRTALTGGVLGQTNASADNTRVVPAGAYRAVIIVNAQPAATGPLLAGADVGTPQRFLWVAATDPDAPDAAAPWPGSLDWAPPEETSESVTYPDHVAAEIRAARLAGVRGEAAREDSHALLTRLKAAAALARLHGETAITDQWWGLAGLLMEHGTAVQSQAREAAARAALDSSRWRGKLDAERALGTAETRADRVAKAAEAIARTVAAHAAGRDAASRKHDPDAGCTQRCITRALRNFPDRGELMKEALDEAEDNDAIVTRGGRYYPGTGS